MSFEPLPEDLQEFLCRRIHSYEELEALLFLRSHGGEAWSADSVAEQLRISSTAADEALEQLCRQGLLQARVEGGGRRFKFALADPALEELVNRFARACTEDRIEIMKLMSSNAVERVRSSVLRTFADAFLVGRKKDG